MLFEIATWCMAGGLLVTNPEHAAAWQPSQKVGPAMQVPPVAAGLCLMLAAGCLQFAAHRSKKDRGSDKVLQQAMQTCQQKLCSKDLDRSCCMVAGRPEAEHVVRPFTAV